jgi:hypothetical protein
VPQRQRAFRFGLDDIPILGSDRMYPEVPDTEVDLLL